MNLELLRERVLRYVGERAKPRSDARAFRGYRLAVDTYGYSVYVPPYKCEQVLAAYGDVSVTRCPCGGSTMFIYPYANSRIRHRITLDRKHFPGLIAGSRIDSCLLVPYMRVVKPDSYVKSVRLVVITDKAQIFHNYPARARDCDGYSRPGDILRFEESVVWDLPGRKYPSRSVACTDTERYFPGLPDECYKRRPMVNTDAAFSDPYGNGGFSATAEITLGDGSTATVPRFYIHKRVADANPFHFMGRGDFDEKMCLLGTYRSNSEEGVRTCIFASSDGGRSWYCKYEFADLGEYDFVQGHGDSWGRNFGNPILRPDDLGETELRVSRRRLILPTEESKEPATTAVLEPIGEVAQITADSHLTLRTAEPHGLANGCVVALNGRCSGLEWSLNDGDPTENLLKAEVLDECTLRLYELVSSPDACLPCRHVHHINRVKDGWVIGTGEIYPNGWLLYAQMREADTFTRKSAADHLPVIRLNSTELSVQRTLGAVMRDDADRTLIYASDHDMLEYDSEPVCEGRTGGFMRGSTGIYRGALRDVDDRRKFATVYEAREPAFFFQELDGMIVFCGQRGELAVSLDGGESFTTERLPSTVIHYRGSSGRYYYFDSCIIKRK